MAKKKNSVIAKLLGFLVWITGVLVALAVAFGMISGVLAIPWIGANVLAFFGWVVVVTTLLGVILAIAKLVE